MTKKALARLRAQIAREMPFQSCGCCDRDGWIDIADDYSGAVVRCRCWDVHQAKVDQRLAEVQANQ